VAEAVEYSCFDENSYQLPNEGSESRNNLPYTIEVHEDMCKRHVNSETRNLNTNLQQPFPSSSNALKYQRTHWE
jgi:hypothetical protein